MNYSKTISIGSVLSLVLLMATLLGSCTKEEEGFPITNDLRVLQKKVGNTVVADGVTDLSVLSEIQLVFSHALNRETFEAALTVSPEVSYSVTYDESGSIVTIAPTTRFAYETNYEIELPVGTYGANGESSVEEFEFNFTTKAFAPPKITLTSSTLSFFEGEEVTVTATLDNIIFDDVTFDLVFGGTAEGGGVDYTTSATSLTIPAGSTSASFTITSIAGDAVEGTEFIIISLSNVVNGSNDPPQELTLSLGDVPPAIELKGILSLKIGGTATNGRAIHLIALEDISDLSVYGIGIANNGGGTDGREIDFPAISVSAGEDILMVRDIDVAGLSTYFGSCYTGFEHIVPTGLVNFNGDDAVELFQDNVVIETFGEITFSAGSSLAWDYTGSWAYKLGEDWIYGGVNCSSGSTTTQSSNCVYPMCSEGLEFLGIMSLQPTAGRIRAYHLRALKDIDDLSAYDVRIASNGASTFGSAIPFPSQAVKEGDQILLVRDLDVTRAAGYFGSCYSKFNHVIASGSVTSNGDDAIGLHKNGSLIETFGVVGVDGTGQVWDYEDSWAFKVGSAWTYGGVGCTVGAASNATSSCPYTFCN